MLSTQSTQLQAKITSLESLIESLKGENERNRQEKAQKESEVVELKQTLKAITEQHKKLEGIIQQQQPKNNVSIEQDKLTVSSKYLFSLPSPA